MVSKTLSLTKGAGGPSQLDAMQYHHLLSSRKYKVENRELRTQIAILARKLATETLDPLTLEAYVSCRLIPLDKNPVSDRLVWKRFCAELWVNALDGC